MTHSAARPVFTGALCFLSLLLTTPANSLPPGSGVLYFVHNDPNGTPQALTDEAGKAVWKAQTDPFGSAVVDNDPDGDGQAVEFNVRAPGQYHDRETGLHYNYFRYYDPGTGRYLTSDPIGLRASLNTYTYVDNDPLNSIDPTGLVKLYGSWCGPDWSGGFRRQYDQLDTVQRRVALPPVDDLDQCCQKHDITYADCRLRFPCNAEARQSCFQQADRKLNQCAGVTRGSARQFLLLLLDPANGGDPNRAISDYMRDSIPPSEENAQICTCENK